MTSLEQSYAKRMFIRSLEKKNSLGNGDQSSMSTYHNWRTGSLDATVYSNPFVDKSEIPNHKKKVKELWDKNEKLYNIYRVKNNNIINNLYRIHKAYLHFKISLGSK